MTEANETFDLSELERLTGLSFGDDVKQALDLSGLASNEDIRELKALANRQLQLEQAVATIEATLSEVKEQLQQVQTVLLPQAMQELGISEFKLDNGHKISVQPFYSCSLIEGLEDKAFAWLRDRGHGDIIKHEIKVDFKMKEDQQAEQLRALLAEQGFTYSDKASIHSSTLRAWIRGQYESGELPPADCFKMYAGSKAVIK